MLSAEEHPGIFTFLIGISVLVMAGVGLSLLIDRRLDFSSGIVRIQREINHDAMEFEHLKAWHDEQSRLLNESSLKLQIGAGTNGQGHEELKVLHQRKTVLEAKREQLRKAIFSQNEDFSHCRAEYRRKTWLAAIGENLGGLKIRSGREYKQATITRVTDVGLEIRHEDGIARIQAPDLDFKLQDRFQWKDDERRQALEEEFENLEGKTDRSFVGDFEGNQDFSKSPVQEVSRLLRSNPSAATDEELSGLRHLVSDWQAKVNELSRDHQEATFRSDHGPQKSVPGSLETWNARASRLENALARVKGELVVAKARLAALAPNDPLVRPSIHDR